MESKQTKITWMNRNCFAFAIPRHFTFQSKHENVAMHFHRPKNSSSFQIRIQRHDTLTIFMFLTNGDVHVCEHCQAVADNSSRKIETKLDFEYNARAPSSFTSLHWMHFELNSSSLHINCRDVVACSDKRQTQQEPFLFLEMSFVFRLNTSKHIFFSKSSKSWTSKIIFWNCEATRIRWLFVWMLAGTLFLVLV